MARLQSLLLATDFRQSSNDAAEVTIRLAQTYDATVTVLHVREEFITWPDSPFENQDRLTQRLAEQQVRVAEFLVHAGPPAATVIRKAQELDTDLLVIGAGEKLRDGHLALGPTAETILEQSTAPVLALNPHGTKLQFQTILCPVDHSRVAKQALQDAIQLVQTFGGRLHVLSVVPDVGWFTAVAETGRFTEAKLEHEAKWAREFDEFLASISFGDIAWERELRCGEPHEQIAAATRERGADLLVIGATGRTGIARVLLGSVTRRVLRHLSSSVMVVKDRVAFDEQRLLEIDVTDQLAAEGQVKIHVGAYAEAAGKFRQALALDPYHLGALEGLIQASEQLGHHEIARRHRTLVERLRRRTTA